MKISKEHYARLKGLIQNSASVKTHGVMHMAAVYVKGHGEGSIKAQDIHKRLRWDIWHTIPIAPRMAILNDMYVEGLHDDHIDTALKKIVKELSNDELMNA